MDDIAFRRIVLFRSPVARGKDADEYVAHYVSDDDYMSELS
jgi:hypothetical protein